MDSPFRLIQTNLRETDAALDAGRLVRQLDDFGANTLLFGMGGIAAYYPTKVQYHYPSPHLPPGRDLFGDVLAGAHARGIRVIGRFDLSKAQKPAYDAHPEWFMKRASGQPVIYNGLYSACINGGWYRGQALRILEEALDRYDVDGLFFNMFGNQASDYSGNPIGPCRCDACLAKFRAKYGRDVPASPDAEYREFLAESSREVAGEFARLIHSKRPRAGFFTYIQQHTDGIMSESNTAVGRPLPLWPYSASDNVDRARNSEPDKMAVNLCMSFVDYPWRFVTVPQSEIRLRLWQAMAHGSGPALNMHGTMDQEDSSALLSARPVFQWHKEHEHLYVRQQSGARVLLLGGRQNSYRGFFRLLSERHIPFAVSDNLDWIGKRNYDLVIAPDGAPARLDGWLRAGGRLLVAGAKRPDLDLPPATTRQAIRGYWRVRDRAMFPSLANTKLLLLDGEYAELAPTAKPLLTLIPPAMFGPPEKVWVDKRESETPGLLIADYGKGRIAWIPWDIGGMYYRLSSEGHAGLVSDVVDHLLPGGRQLKSNAHALVEITVMRQGARTLVHLVNLTGHSDTAYFAPVPMSDIEVSLAGKFSRARAASAGTDLAVSQQSGYTRFRIPRLDEYEVVVLE